MAYAIAIDTLLLMTTNVYLPLDICKERILCFTRSTIITASLIGTNVTHTMFLRPQQNMIIPMNNTFLHVTIFQTNSEKSLTNRACFEEYISETYTNRISEAVNRFHAFLMRKGNIYFEPMIFKGCDRMCTTGFGYG